jgi:DNA end-binding protein Ku
MPAHSVWSGFLRVSLVTIPVKAHVATSEDSGRIALNQIHKDCHSRIRYRKICPIHGEIAAEDIVMGYEFAKDQYVVIDPEEVNKLRPESDKVIEIDGFLGPSVIDPLYYGDKSYYLLPDGAVAFKPYALMLDGMRALKTFALVKLVWHNRDRIALVRPRGKLLSMTMLHLESQVAKPAAFEADVPPLAVGGEEMQLTKTLIAAHTPKKVDLGKYRDRYTERLQQLIDAKVAGKEIVTPPEEDVEQTQVINLMEALRKSVAQSAGEKAKPPKRAAKSMPKKPGDEKKRKKSS